MATISQTRTGMIGKCDKPFCGNCCAQFRPGHGKARKRVGKHLTKRREARRVAQEIEQDLGPVAPTWEAYDTYLYPW